MNQPPLEVRVAVAETQIENIVAALGDLRKVQVEGFNKLEEKVDENGRSQRSALWGLAAALVAAAFTLAITVVFLQ